ncbi:hypothetical protein [Microvirga puerhi]|uniref:Uncharacterized protein n=1 Tax=Microvirga puerhi TaxID=2876078 RepID=A0ABS7VT85_9HYPH|nr:hypothetical protein [Microvirga puerhi]MBZ6078778.1 hypothetical protein [Microvirga puerhi]
MDQPYSIVADWLSKFHIWPEFIQALWVIAIPVTVLGTAWIMMRGVREIVVAARGEGRGRMAYGVIREGGNRLLSSHQPVISPASSSPALSRGSTSFARNDEMPRG